MLQEAAKAMVLSAVKQGGEYVLSEPDFDRFCHALRASPDPALDEHLERIKSCPPGPVPQ